MQEVWRALSQHTPRQGQPYSLYGHDATEAHPLPPDGFPLRGLSTSSPIGDRTPLYSHALICMCVALVRQRRAVLLRQHQFHDVLHTLSQLTRPMATYEEADEKEKEVQVVEEGEVDRHPRQSSSSWNTRRVPSSASDSFLPPKPSTSNAFGVERWLKDAVAMLYAVPPSVGLASYSAHHTALFLIHQGDPRRKHVRRKRRGEADDNETHSPRGRSASPSGMPSSLVCASVARSLSSSSAFARLQRQHNMWRRTAPLLWKYSPCLSLPLTPSPSLLPLLTSLHLPLSCSSALYPSHVIPFMSAADVWRYWKQWECIRLRLHPASPFERSPRQKTAPSVPESTVDAGSFSSSSSSVRESFPGLVLIDARTCLPLPPAFFQAASFWSSSSSCPFTRSAWKASGSPPPTGVTNSKKKNIDPQPSMATAAPDKEKKKHYRHHHRRRGDLVSHSSASSTSSHSSSVSSSSMTGKSTLRPSSPLASSIPRKKLLLMEEEDDVESSRSSTSSTRTATHSLRASPHRRPSSRTATRSSERGHQERHRRRKKEKKKKKGNTDTKRKACEGVSCFHRPVVAFRVAQGGRSEGRRRRGGNGV